MNNRNNLTENLLTYMYIGNRYESWLYSVCKLEPHTHSFLSIKLRLHSLFIIFAAHFNINFLSADMAPLPLCPES